MFCMAALSERPNEINRRGGVPPPETEEGRKTLPGEIIKYGVPGNMAGDRWGSTKILNMRTDPFADPFAVSPPIRTPEQDKK
jgi:hypothetical protein